MQLIFRFIAKYKYFLFFLFLEFIALFFTIQSHSYHKSKFINSANNITGGFYKKTNSINEFFNLKKENQQLANENSHLKNILSLRICRSISEKIIQPLKNFEENFQKIDIMKFL